MRLFYAICRAAASRAWVWAPAAMAASLLAACGAAPGAAPAPPASAPPPAVTLAALASATPSARAEATATAASTPTPTPTEPTPTPRVVWPAPIARFEIEAVLPEAEVTGRLIGFHLTASDVAFRVHYAPGEPRYMSQWAFELSRSSAPPLLIFPAGFFTEDYLAQGLLVSDGEVYGQAHGIGGVFVVQGGQPDIRWLRAQPISPDEEFEQGVQAFPVYMNRGSTVRVNEHVTRAPRTVIAETESGDFIVLFSFTGLFRTTDLPQWLAESELEIYNALNLDGGRSTGYWAGPDDFRDTYVPLPAVIAAYAR